MDEFKAYCYTEGEVAALLGIEPSTLRQRIYTGGKHPPYQSPTRGVYWFPKDLFIDWARKRLPVKTEVENAS